MLPKNILRDYLSFSRKDRWGLFTLIFLILVIYFLPFFFARPAPLPLQKNAFVARAIDTLRQREASSKTNAAERYKGPPPDKGFIEGALFSFDPNTLDAGGWRRLGLGERPLRTVLNFRSKGGRFYKPEDLQKIWGLPEEFYQRVKDHIAIPPSSPRFQAPSNEARPAYKKEPRTANVNEADSAALESLPGIGARLASRIVRYRSLLGGFHSVDQIGELYGLPDSIFQKMRPFLQVGGPVRRLNINTATKDELKAHPYIRWALANAIVEYRAQHGPYKSIDDLKLINLITEEVFEKFKWYVETK